MAIRRQMELNKGIERFVFEYDEGREDELLDMVVAVAKDRRISFDWFDAAVISSRLSRMLIGNAERLLRM